MHNDEMCRMLALIWLRDVLVVLETIPAQSAGTPLGGGRAHAGCRYERPEKKTWMRGTFEPSIDWPLPSASVCDDEVTTSSTNSSQSHQSHSGAVAR